MAENLTLTDTLLAWRYGNTACYISIAVLFLIGIAAVFITHDMSRARWAFVGLAIALLPIAAEWLTGIRFPWLMKFLITLSLVLHLAGGVFGFYFSLYPVYDKIAHLVTSMAISFLIFMVILVAGGLFKKHPGRAWIAWGIFLTAMVLGLFWEYAELFIDLSSGTTYFVNRYDSFFDVVFNTLGSAYIALTVNSFLKTDSFEQCYHRFIQRER